jgi:hypothetical protein
MDHAISVSIPRLPTVVIEDDIDRQAMREHADSNFSSRVMAERYVQVYEQIIASHKKPTPAAQCS